MGATAALARFVTTTDFCDLPSDVIEHAKICILDWIGAALAGSPERPAKIITSIVKDAGSKGEATVIGARLKSSCMNAAMANGVIGHCVELDDVHGEAIIHPAAPVLPAALAAAEHEKSSGMELISAAILGYEVEIRIGKAICPSHYRYWHPTGTCGTFGATAAVGKILHLGDKKMVQAFGIAGTQAAGLIEVFGTENKSLNPGRAAANGVLAALLAQRGLSSSSDILEAEKGYCNATSDNFDQDKIAENLGKRFEIVNNIFKRHASCGHTHGAIDALLTITETHTVKPEDIEEIVVRTYPIASEVVGKNYRPHTKSEAKFSLPYCLAIALVRGKVGLDDFSEELLGDPRILKIARKVKVTLDPRFVGARLGSADITIRARNGSISRQVLEPKGYPSNPLTKNELQDKFRSLASVALANKKVEAVVQTVDNLERMDSIHPLMELLYG